MFEVTLKDLRAAGACHSGYNKVIRALQNKPFTDDDALLEIYIRLAYKHPISLIKIIESNGLDDALWALQCVKNHDRDMQLYAVWCARQVQHLMTDARSINALDVAEKFANGEATIEELDAACNAAWAAAWNAAWAAQKDMFIKMCNGTAPWQV